MTPNWLSGFCPSTVVRILATQQKQISKLTFRIDLFIFYTQICLCHLLAISTHLFTHWAAWNFFNLRPFRFRIKLLSRQRTVTRLTSVGSGVACGQLPTFLNFPRRIEKKCPFEKAHSKGEHDWVDESIYIPIEHGDFPASTFWECVNIWVVAVTTREAYIVPCGTLKSNLNDPEWGASEGIRPWQFRIVVGWCPNLSEK